MASFFITLVALSKLLLKLRPVTLNHRDIPTAEFPHRRRGGERGGPQPLPTPLTLTVTDGNAPYPSEVGGWGVGTGMPWTVSLPPRGCQPGGHSESYRALLKAPPSQP